MRAFKVSKQSILTLEEKIIAINTYDVNDLHYILREFENNPRDYEKEVIVAVINKLFELGVTSL